MEDDRRLRDLLGTIAARFAAIETATALPSDTVAVLGELTASTTAFLAALTSPTTVLNAVLPA